MKKLQDKYNKLGLEISKLIDKQNKVVEEATKDGYALFNGYFKENITMYGMFYNIGYYSHFDGHLSEAIHDYESGVDEITSEDFKRLTELHHLYSANPSEELEGEAFELMQNLSSEYFFYQEEFLKYMALNDDDSLEWKYKGSDDQGELHSGSSIIFRLTTKQEISKTKRKKSKL